MEQLGGEDAWPHGAPDPGGEGGSHRRCQQVDPEDPVVAGDEGRPEASGRIEAGPRQRRHLPDQACDEDPAGANSDVTDLSEDP